MSKGATTATAAVPCKHCKKPMTLVWPKYMCEGCAYFIDAKTVCQHCKLNCGGQCAAAKAQSHCSVCDRTGHTDEACWRTKTCNGCGRKGHIESRCRAKQWCSRCQRHGHSLTHCRVEQMAALGHATEDCWTKICDGCGKLGHTRESCFAEHACDECGRHGHATDNCRTPKCSQCGANHFVGKCPLDRCALLHPMEASKESPCALCAAVPAQAHPPHALKDCERVTHYCQACALSPKYASLAHTHVMSACAYRHELTCRACKQAGHPKALCGAWSKMEGILQRRLERAMNAQ